MKKLKYKSPWTNDTEKITPLLANMEYEGLRFPNEKEDEIIDKSKSKVGNSKEKLRRLSSKL